MVINVFQATIDNRMNCKRVFAFFNLCRLLSYDQKSIAVASVRSGGWYYELYNFY